MSTDENARSLDQLVNACLLPGFGGRELPDWARRAMDDGVPGFVLYGQNLTSADDVRPLADEIRSHRPDAHVALDEEGGDVTRLHYATGSYYPGNLALGHIDDESLTYDVARAIAADLTGAAVTMNFAPCLDVNSDPRNPVIGVRSFGSDPELVARHGVAAVRGLQDGGVVAVAKHFPGHGATTADSHLALPVIDCDVETFRSRELLPFVAAAEAGVDAVMTSHVVFAAVDSKPATLSRRLLTDLLRAELGFDGAIVTDALDMAGVRAKHGIAGAAVRSLAAGADVLLLGSEDGERHCAGIRTAVREALQQGALELSRLEDAAHRASALRPRDGATAAPPPVARRSLGLDAARRAVRAFGVDPLQDKAVVVELRGETNLAVGAAHWSVADPLDRLGGLREAVTVTPDGPEPAAATVPAAGHPLVVAVRDAYRQPWQRAWVERALAARPDAVLVALGMPEDAQLTRGGAVLAYGAGRVNTLAAAERLTGRQVTYEVG